MDDLRLFLKKITKNQGKLSIAYRDGYNLYKYKFDGFELLFKEMEEEVHLTLDKKTYTNFNEIQLLLFDLFDYKNIEYIDIYLQLKIEKSGKRIYIEDIYNDYYDDITNELICIRNIHFNDCDLKEKIIKLKFIVIDDSEYNLFINHETIQGFDEILTKINQLF